MDNEKLKVVEQEYNENLSNAGKANVKFISTATMILIIIVSLGTCSLVKVGKIQSLKDRQQNKKEHTETTDSSYVDESQEEAAYEEALNNDLLVDNKEEVVESSEEVEETKSSESELKENVASITVGVNTTEESKEEVETVSSVSPSKEFSVSGSFVDSHVNSEYQQLYIFNQNDVKAIEEANQKKNGTVKSSNNSKSTSSVKPSTSTPSAVNSINVSDSSNVVINQNNNTTINNNNGVQDDVLINQEATSSKNKDKNKDKVTTNITIPEPIDDKSEDKGQEIYVYEGYVMRKLNYSSDGMWFTFYQNDGQVCVNCDDMSMLDESLMDANNSNIYGISLTKEVPGWVYVRDNNVNDQNLGMVSDFESECSRLVSMYKEALSTGNYNVDPSTPVLK